MCTTCDGSGRINGRIEHERIVAPSVIWCLSGGSTSATYARAKVFHSEGNVPCPECQPTCYGRITKIEKR